MVGNERMERSKGTYCITFWLETNYLLLLLWGMIWALLYFTLFNLIFGEYTGDTKYRVGLYSKSPRVLD